MCDIGHLFLLAVEFQFLFNAGIDLDDGDNANRWRHVDLDTARQFDSVRKWVGAAPRRYDAWITGRRGTRRPSTSGDKATGHIAAVGHRGHAGDTHAAAWSHAAHPHTSHASCSHAPGAQTPSTHSALTHPAWSHGAW